MGAECNGKEDTQHKRPKTAALAVHTLQPFAHAMVVLVVMATREEQQHTANNHERRQHRLAPMVQEVFDALRARSHNKRYRQERIGGQLAQYEHQSVEQHFAAVVDFLVNIPNSSNTREECARVKNHQETQ